MTAEQLNAIATYDSDGFVLGRCIGCGSTTTARMIIRTSANQDSVEKPLCRPCKGEWYRIRGWE